MPETKRRMSAREHAAILVQFFGGQALTMVLEHIENYDPKDDLPKAYWLDLYWKVTDMLNR